jgi:hypothetical protein
MNVLDVSMSWDGSRILDEKELIQFGKPAAPLIRLPAPSPRKRGEDSSFARFANLER